MRGPSRRDQAGFTLVELVVTIGIIGILAAIAVPAYSSYVRQANRSDATQTMLAYAQGLQRCYSQNFTYLPSPATCAPTAATYTSPGGYYQITVAIPSATSYTITAVPTVAPQTSDAVCTSFTLSSTGVQSSGGTGTAKTCWGQ